ncbi:MAG: hypothetical protein CVU06_05360 [Bacteroidetes bacterium HGW-Bacteroidetes-22]|nr:MAG: hypothetical protein CVU06_05360 [Bacteroidetes bacterium HGW-Bacteroidetes-22]
MNVNQGIVCKLTGAKAAFADTCPQFDRDLTIVEKLPDDVQLLSKKELSEKLSVEQVEKLRLDQNLLMGIIAGAVTGIVLAIIWAVITVATGYQIGYMAIGVGAGVGITIRFFGKGIDTVFGVWGAVVSLISCLVGDILSIIGYFAYDQKLGFFETIKEIDFSYLSVIMLESVSINTLVFYVIALTFGYKLSFRKITQKDLIEIKQK